jgi:hypothetical protein
VFVTEKAVAEAHSAREALRNAEETFNRRFVGPSAETPRTRTHGAAAAAALVSAAGSPTFIHATCVAAASGFSAAGFGASAAYVPPGAAAAPTIAFGANSDSNAFPAQPSCPAWGVAPDLATLLAPRVEQVAPLMAGKPACASGLGGASLSLYHPVPPSRGEVTSRQPRLTAGGGNSPRPRTATGGARTSKEFAHDCGGEEPFGKVVKSGGGTVPARPFSACARTCAAPSVRDPCTDACGAAPLPVAARDALADHAPPSTKPSEPPFTKPSVRWVASGGYNGRPASARACADSYQSVVEAMAQVVVSTPSAKQTTGLGPAPGHASHSHYQTTAFLTEKVYQLPTPCIASPSLPIAPSTTHAADATLLRRAAASHPLLQCSQPAPPRSATEPVAITADQRAAAVATARARLAGRSTVVRAIRDGLPPTRALLGTHLGGCFS